MKKSIALLTALFLIICLASCGQPQDLTAPLPGEGGFDALNEQLVQSAPSTAYAIIYGEDIIPAELTEQKDVIELPHSDEAGKIALTAVADNTKYEIADESGNILWAGELNSGETAIIIMNKIPADGGCRLLIEKNGKSVYSDINLKTTDPAGWVYVVE